MQTSKKQVSKGKFAYWIIFFSSTILKIQLHMICDENFTLELIFLFFSDPDHWK